MKEAVASLKESVSLNPEEGSTYYLLAQALKKSGDEQGAASAMERVRQSKDAGIQAERDAMEQRVVGVR